jgi:hypothetical protein
VLMLFQIHEGNLIAGVALGVLGAVRFHGRGCTSAI